jgi:hypothetical protein
MPVINSQNCVPSWLRVLAATAESPQVKLERRRHEVSITMLRGSNRSCPEGPPAVALQHRVRREERGEHHDVAEQKNPEPIPDDDALGSRTAFTVPG